MVINGVQIFAGTEALQNVIMTAGEGEVGVISVRDVTPEDLAGKCGCGECSCGDDCHCEGESHADCGCHGCH